MYFTSLFTAYDFQGHLIENDLNLAQVVPPFLRPTLTAYKLKANCCVGKVTGLKGLNWVVNGQK